MKNAIQHSPHSPSQPTLPGVRDWTQPITVRGSELAAIIAEAQAQGFNCHRMTVTDMAVYRLLFWKLPSATVNERVLLAVAIEQVTQLDFLN